MELKVQSVGSSGIEWWGSRLHPTENISAHHPLSKSENSVGLQVETQTALSCAWIVCSGLQWKHGGLLDEDTLPMWVWMSRSQLTTVSDDCKLLKTTKILDSTSAIWSPYIRLTGPQGLDSQESHREPFAKSNQTLQTLRADGMLWTAKNESRPIGEDEPNVYIEIEVHTLRF